MLYIHIHLYFFLVRFVQSHLLIVLLQILHFWGDFQVRKGENFSLSTHLRCFSSTFMFSVECTFEQLMQCSFKTGSRNKLRGVVFFFLGNNNSGEMSLTSLKKIGKSFWSRSRFTLVYKDLGVISFGSQLLRSHLAGPKNKQTKNSGVLK